MTYPLTTYQLKYYAHELQRNYASDHVGKLAGLLACMAETGPEHSPVGRPERLARRAQAGIRHVTLRETPTRGLGHQTATLV